MKRRNIKRIFSSYAFLLVLLVLLLFLLRGLWNVYGKFQAAYSSNTETEQTLVELKEREAELSQMVERLQTERGVEEEIRERFNVAKENEGVIYVIEEDTPQTSTTPEEPQKTPENKGFWKTLTDFFRRE